jgi:CopG family nickel-responsive transcriptional regulator
MAIKRFGVSLEENVLKKLDELVEKHHLPNRSQAIRFLIREHMVEDQWNDNQQVAGTITLLFDHHKRDLSNQSTAIQHDFHHQVLSVQHIHLNHDNCLETIVVRGKASDLINLADRLIGIKGIKHGKLVMTSLE